MTKQFLSTLSTLVLASVLVFFCSNVAVAQNQDHAYRLYDNNDIAWYQTAATLRFHDKWDAVAEYSWRRADWGATWQQSLTRVGLTYYLTDDVQVRGGYSFIESFPFGDYSSIKPDYTQLEHRTYEQIQFKSVINRIGITHRLRLEQRWIGTHQGTEAITSWAYNDRFRYQIRADIPLQAKKLGDKQFYAAAFDEVMLNWGPNLKTNIFDQNRLGLLVGYRFSPQVKLEAGYFNQIVQQGGYVNNRFVILNNTGPLVSLLFNIDTRHKETAPAEIKK